MAYKGQWLVDYAKNYPQFRTYKKGLNISPQVIIFAVTHNCASKCIMCNFWMQTERNELSLTEIETLFSSPVLSKLRFIDLTGGDALMRKDLAEIVDIAHRVLPQAEIGIGTAALMPDVLDKFLTQTKGKVGGVFISLDGLEKEHNEIRGRDDSYKLTMESLKVMKSHGLKQNINMTITPQNYDKILDVYKAFPDHSFSCKEAQVSESYFGDNHEKSLALSKEQREKVLEQLEQIPEQSLFDYYHKTWVKDRKRPSPCYAGASSLYVSSLGDVHPCINKPSLGNLRQNTLEEIWYSQETEAKRPGYRKCTDCYARCTLDTFAIDEPKWVFKMRINKLLAKVFKPQAQSQN